MLSLSIRGAPAQQGFPRLLPSLLVEAPVAHLLVL